MPEVVATPTKSLVQLRAELGPPDPELIATLLADSAKGKYQADGREIASDRVIKDAERMFGLAYAFWMTASDEQKDALVGFSLGLLAAGVDQALALRAAVEALDGGGTADTSARIVSTTAITEAAARGLKLRDQGVVILRTIAGARPTLLERIAVAIGTAENPDELARGLERVAALGKELVASDDKTTATMVKHTRASSAYFERLSGAALDLRAAVEAGRPRLTARTVSQGDIDILDGVVLRVLGDVMHTFAAAQDIDGSVPTIAPNATRRLLATRRKARPQTAVPPVIPTA